MTYPSPVEEKKPSFWKRPVSVWVFVLVIVVLVLFLFVPSFFIPVPPTIQQPLVLSPDSRTMFISANQSTAIDFSVVDLNATNNISANVTATLSYFSNSMPVPASGNVTLTVYGVYTGTTFTAATSSNSVSFQPGGNTLVINLKAQNATPELYTITVALSS
jgi:hypothetical protein